MNKIKCIAAAGLAATVMTACSAAGRTAPATYEMNRTPAERLGGAGQKGEISDMLPALSEDTRVISVEETQKLIPDGAEDTEE